MPRAFHYAISAACAVLLCMLAVVPESFWESFPAVCLFRNVLGVECLGCGMTRALAALLHGRPAVALELNRGVIFAAAALLIGAAHVFWPRFRRI